VKWFNVEKGFGFTLAIAAGRTCSSTSRPSNDPGSPPSMKVSESSLMSSTGCKGLEAASVRLG
jgi:hypothetical protein